nr:rho GTPase-activating protein 20-like [Peromyscus maniculatus bairdii]
METVNEKVVAGEMNIQYLMFHGPVEFRRGCSSKNCHLHLYRDFLVVTNSRSSAQKREWYTLLQRSINEHKEKDRGKSIALEILTEDIPNWNTSFTVTAAQLDTVNDIIRKLQPLLGIPNAEEDYQLWFSSSQKEAPCPLLGKHLRNLRRH